jgi:PAS domain-containing protein
MKRTPYLFSAASPMAERLLAIDWDPGPLGPPQDWDAALKTLVPIMLASSQPMFIVWGAGRTLIYNDGYAEILAAKHPAAIGCDFLEVWHEIRDSLAPIVAAAYRGEPIQMNDIELWMDRRGYREETHFSFFYSPVRTETGEVGGFFCACNEITAQILAERRLSESEARHRGVRRHVGVEHPGGPLCRG